MKQLMRRIWLNIEYGRPETFLTSQIEERGTRAIQSQYKSLRRKYFAIDHELCRWLLYSSYTSGGQDSCRRSLAEIVPDPLEWLPSTGATDYDVMSFRRNSWPSTASDRNQTTEGRYNYIFPPLGDEQLREAATSDSSD